MFPKMWLHHAHPQPSRRQRTVPTPELQRTTTADPGSGNLHLGGEVELGTLASPTAAAQWARPALPARATRIPAAVATSAPWHRWVRKAKPSSTRGGRREKPPHRRHRSGELPERPRVGGENLVPFLEGRNHLLRSERSAEGTTYWGVNASHSRGGGGGE